MKSTRGERIFLCGILLVAMPLVGCRQLGVRMEIQNANRAYAQRRYDVALEHYLAARQIDPSMVDLDRLIGYCYIGRFEPENETKENQQVADQAIESLKRYLVARPDDLIARDTLISLFLAADRNAQAIGFFADHLKKHPGDLDAAKSIATLSAKAGDFPGALHWYREITLLDAVVLLAVFGGLMAWTIWQGLRKKEDALGTEMEQELDVRTMPIRRAVFWLVVGLALLSVAPSSGGRTTSRLSST